MTGSPGLWLRWSWRELRRRLPLAIALAIMIGLGTGLYAGLTSTSRWRQQSYDASFSRLDVHDLRVRLSPGSTVPRGALTAAVASLPDARAVAGAAERLVFPIELDAAKPDAPKADAPKPSKPAEPASTAGDGVLARGEVVGLDLTARPPIDAVSTATGRPLGPADRGAPVGVLDRTFGRANHLPATGTIRLSGGEEIRYVGQGQSPEYFVLPGEQPGLITQTGFGVLYTSLETAQRLAGQPGAVNDLVITVHPGTDVPALSAELSRALATRLPDVSATITDRNQIVAHHILYDAVDSDQRLWDALALLVLLGAAFAAFNLIGRVVDAQRREIGIGMALGVPSGLLALRPLLLGLQIAVLGIGAGIGVGLLIMAAMGSLLRDVWPLPVWHTGFQAGVFARAAALGLVLPLLAAFLPVWRAVRVEPVHAIRVTAVAGRGGPLVSLLRRLPLPGGSLAQMPLRNVARAPRRLILTALGIAAAITGLVVFTGELDTFSQTTDRSESELTRSAPDRLHVTLPAVEPVTAPTVTAVAHSPAVAQINTTLVLPGKLLDRGRANGDGSVDVLTYILDIDRGLWSPSVSRGSPTGGVLLAEKAAHDLGVGPGGTVVLRHPRRVGTGYQTVDTPLRVAGIHGFPVRSIVFLNRADAGSFNLAGATNVLVVQPAPGYSRDAAMRAIFAIPGIGTVAPATADTEEIRALLRGFVGILRIGEVVVLLMTLLIAYTAMSIAMDERRREHATMLAYGLPARTVLALTVAESAMIGLLGTVLGLAAGYWALRWTVEVLLARTVPDLSVRAVLSGRTVAATLLLGVGAVAVAPLLAARRVRRMDVPSTLRVFE